MERIELEIIALSQSVTQAQSYAVVLGEVKGSRRLPIVIGGFEAQAIAVALENMTPSRPLTHDLLKSICDTYDVELNHIVINNLVDGIFYAQLVCSKDGETIEIDSRTSDAIALAVRFKCPIYTYEFILDSAGITVEEATEMGAEPESEEGEIDEETLEEEIERVTDANIYEDYTLAELEELLESALAKEDYEKAARIRDEMNKRK
jgi:bifunctional DNase/RNase